MSASGLLRAAERICSTAFGLPVELAPPEAVRDWDGRTWTRRCGVIDPQPGLPQSVIVKQFRLGGGHGMSEWAGLEFFDRLDLDPPLTPRLFGGDIGLGLIVTEDFGDVREHGLSAILDGSDSIRAGDALVAASAALGRLHSASYGGEEEYREIRSQLPAAGHEPFHQAFRTGEALGRFVENASLSGVPPASGTSEELDRIMASLNDPGPFRTFTHGDACASNIVLLEGSVRFFDLEVSGFRHALIDGAFVTLRLLGCQESGGIPESVLSRMEAMYRQELTARIPEAADDDRFNTELVAMTAVWLALLLDRLRPSLEKDRKLVTGTNRQRILFALDRFAGLAAERDRFPALAATARATHDRLATLWPGDEHRLAPFPAFA